MPRDPGGSYTFPLGSGNPVVPETTIQTTWANPTLNDLATAMTDSLSRSGQGGMTFSLRGPDGSAAVPTFSFTNETNTGRYRSGNGIVVESVQGNNVVRYLATGLEQWNGSTWEPLTPRDAIDTPFDPAPTTLTSTNVQDAIEEVYATTGGTVTAANVTYDDSNVYFGAPTVQIAIDIVGTDLSATAFDVSVNTGDIVQLGGEIDQNTSAILGLDGRIGANETNIQLNTDAIGNTNTDLTALTVRVTDTENVNIVQDSDIDTLEFTVGQQGTQISTNQQGISDNVSDIDLLESYFTGGVCEIIHGGTGVTTKTGTGSTVGTQSPNITDGQFFDCDATDPPVDDNDFSVANTGWVQRELDGEWWTDSNAAGFFTMNLRTGYKICWGVWPVGDATYSLPLTYTDINTMVVTEAMRGTGGTNRYAIWYNVASTSTVTVNGFTSNYTGSYWMVTGI